MRNLDHVPAIEIKGLHVSFDGNTVLEDINLTVEQGDYLGIIGPNGGGKSTLLRSLLGLITPDRGTIKILGLSLIHILTYVSCCAFTITRGKLQPCLW